MEYHEFRQKYEQMHPASVPVLEEEIGIYPDWLEKVVGIMFICASLLSGVHTVPTVRGGMDISFWGGHIVNIVSLSSFVAIELVFFVAAYAMMRKAQWHVLATLVAAFIVAMVANLQQNFLAYQAGDSGTIIVAVTLGIGAPLIAFMAGKMFVDIHRARRMVGIDAKRNYDTAKKAWDAEINHEWDKYLKAEKKAARVSDPRPTTVQQVSDFGQSEGASERVRNFFVKRPDALLDDKLGVRGIAKHLNVGHQTVSTVRNQMRSEMSKNGHSVPTNGHHDD